MASYWIDTLVLKNRGKYLRYFAAPPFPLQGKTNASAQEVARRISGAIAGEVRASQDLTSNNEPFLESTQKSTYQVPITIPYLPHYIICHLPLVFLSPTSPLPFYSPSLFRLPFFPSLVCSCVGLLARSYG